MRFAGRGHPEIRATHAKTLELGRDDEITGRATCVVAVATTAEPPAPMAGPVRIELEVGGHAVTLNARANPSWDPRGPAVLRRSPLRLTGTFATDCDTTAADLPRDLVEALRDPTARIEARVEAKREITDTVVLFAADPERSDDPRLQAELAAADEVIIEDDPARELVREHGGPPESRETGGARRLLVVATVDLPGARTPPSRRWGAIETVGLAPSLAVAAASPSSGPITVAPPGADIRRMLRDTPSGHRLVVAVRVDQLGALLRLAATERGADGAVLARPQAPPVRIGPDRLPPLPPSRLVHVCLDVADTGEVEAAPRLDPAARAAARTLLADGVSTRTTARALTELTGLSRHDAYTRVLELKDRHPGTSPDA